MDRARIKAKGDGRAPRAVMWVLGPVLIAAGLAVSWFLGVRPLALVVSARGWEERPCEILSSTVRESSDSDGGSTYAVDITYQYEIRGVPYRGDRYDFSTGSSSGYEGKKRVVDRYPAGSRAKCFVNPSDPAVSVINRQPGLYLLIGLIGLPLLAAGAGILVAANKPGPSRFSAVPVPRATQATTVNGDELLLRPRVSNTAMLIGVLFFAAFWNGIVSVFLFGQLVPSFRHGHPDWFLLLFLTPFVAVGLGSIGFAGYRILCFWNPVPELRLRPAGLYPGGPGELSWTISGDIYRVRSFSVRLVAREQVTYRQGTDTRTEHHELHSEVIYESHRPEDFRRASADIAVPGNAMPSFDAPNNKVEWYIEIKGDIPRWPDVSATFPIAVLPYGGGAGS